MRFKQFYLNEMPKAITKKKILVESFLGPCDRFRRTPENEKIWQDMMKNKKKISEKEFLKNVDVNDFLDGETWEEWKYNNSDDDILFFKSNPYYFIQTKGFEFIWKIDKINESFETDYKKFIAYHQTSKSSALKIKSQGFNFKNVGQNIIWFTNNIEGLKNKTLGSINSEVILKLEVNINKAADWELYDDKNLDELQQLKYDGVILKEEDGTFDGFVFSPKQIKVLDILNSAEDIK